MRPLRLTLGGLRSYRDPQTIDFSDTKLMAIVGDTGAGKSSILEAVTYALYGRSTWSGQPGDLISHYADTMRVELEFKADGGHWRVVRSMSHGSQAAVHHLEQVDGDEKVDGKAAVNQRIQQLIGLDDDAFLRTVLLPQGRFAELLTVTPTERTRILKNLFAVDRLVEVRERAQSLHDDLQPQLAALELRRGNLLDDPVAVAEEAEQRAASAESRVAVLTELTEEITALGDGARDARDRATRLRQGAAKVDPSGFGEHLTSLQELLPVAEDLDARMTRARESLEELGAELATAREELAGAESELGKLEDLTASRGSAEAIAGLIAGLHQLVERVVVRRGEVEAAEADLADKKERASTAAAEATEAAEAAKAAGAQSDAAAERLRLAADAATRARDAHEKLAGTENALADARSALESKIADAATANEDAASAKVALDQARAGFEMAQRANHAAAAAAGLHSGDACPVCERDLPEGFSPPVAPQLDEARERVEQAQGAHDEAQGRAAAAGARLEATEKAVADAEAAHDKAAPESAEALGKAAEALGTEIDAEMLGELDTLLAPLRDEAEVATASASELAGAAEAARNDLTGSATAAKHAEKTLADRHGALREVTDDATAAADDVEERALSLPARWQPDLPDLRAAVTDTDPGSVVIDLTPLLEEMAEGLDRLRGLAAEVDARGKKREEQREVVDGLAKECRESVDEPQDEAVSRLTVLASRTADLASDLGTEALPTSPEDRAGLASCVAWAEAVVARASDLATQAAGAAAAADEEADEQERRARTLLGEHDLADKAALEEARAAAMADQKSAARDGKAARDQIPVVTDLDTRIPQCREFLDTLELVRSKLLDSAFINHLITRRQRTLLGVATSILSEVTSGRFGFSADFEVVDQQSGQPRSPRTLSGGESFLASLSLALAMVELAARAGGRLDALFLDEGFGALDADSLDAALDALESRAAKGRLVVVISHVKAVAERIPNVLAVASSPTGTKVGWLTQADRAELVDGDIEASLAGLLA
ncbi:MAG: SMC family ATPase [Actinobacteria bacterium]|nr:MAG: SMC family ATPase [Actinomycetota bacterium]RIK04567.1 MAG: hypothetical protein DCC48_12705 [Acidobacteriota bacterium]